MSDRLTLIATIGARIAALEGSDDVATQAVLKMALAAIVEDAGVIAQAEKRKAKDRRRKAGEPDPAPARALALVVPPPPAPSSNNGNAGNSADVGNSEHSAESAERQTITYGEPAAHITRALGSEVQEQDQKQKLESPDGDSSGVDTPPADDPIGGKRSRRADRPAEGAVSAPFNPSHAVFRPGTPDPSPAMIRAAVDFVIAKYLERHPRRRPGDADRKLIARNLRRYTPAELAEAIDGNADDDWAKSTGKHELSWTLRNNGQIDNYRLKAEAMTKGAEQLATTAQQTGWY